MSRSALVLYKLRKEYLRQKEIKSMLLIKEKEKIIYIIIITIKLTVTKNYYY